jgi:hypothetical protein
LVAASQQLRAALRTWNPVAGSGTRHTALSVRAARCTCLLSAWSTWLAALLCALPVTALDIAGLIAKCACFVAVARLSARVPAIRKGTAALLLTSRMLFLDDSEVLALTALEALASTSVATELHSSTHCIADEVRVVDAAVACHHDCVVTSRNFALDLHPASDLAGVLVLPAR